MSNPNEQIFHCTHCGRKIEAAKPEDHMLLMGALAVMLTSPLMPTPSQPHFVGGCCASELGEWLEPALKLDEDYLKSRDEVQAYMNGMGDQK